MAVTKLPVETTNIFRDAAQKDDLQLTMLDIRLGVEQVVDTDSYFDQAHTYWTEAADAPVLSDDQVNLFRGIDVRTRRLTHEEVVAGFDALLDDDTYQQFCHDRWVRLERLPADDVIVDLAAMPDGV